MSAILLCATLFVAFLNGANDNMKGAATLYGSGVRSYREALATATLSTALGSLASLALASSLVRAFSAKGIIPDDALDPPLLASVALGAGLTILLATRLGFPISTTHALIGGIGGAGFVAAGTQLDLGLLAAAFALPLLVSPLVAVSLAFLGLRGGEWLWRRLGSPASACVCVSEEWRPSSALASSRPGSAGAAAAVGVALERRVAASVGSAEACRHHTGGLRLEGAVQTLVEQGHVLSASLVGFARGLNDTPKILGLLVGGSALSPVLGSVAIAAAMALGGIVAARRVAETMAVKIAPMTPSQGLVANLSTSLLVIGASRLGLPVSTTHVATGGIVGIGGGQGRLHRRVTGEIVAGWVLTLPLAAAFAAAIRWGLG